MLEQLWKDGTRRSGEVPSWTPPYLTFKPLRPTRDWCHHSKTRSKTLQDATDATRRFKTLTETLPRRSKVSPRRPETPILLPRWSRKPTPRPLQRHLKINFIFEVVFDSHVLKFLVQEHFVDGRPTSTKHCKIQYEIDIFIKRTEAKNTLTRVEKCCQNVSQNHPRIYRKSSKNR